MGSGKVGLEGVDWEALARGAEGSVMGWEKVGWEEAASPSAAAVGAAVAMVTVHN